LHSLPGTCFIAALPARLSWGTRTWENESQSPYNGDGNACFGEHAFFGSDVAESVFRKKEQSLLDLFRQT